MKINTLIKELQKTRDKLGNIEVKIQYPVEINGFKCWETNSIDSLITEVKDNKDQIVLIYKEGK